MRKTEDYRPYEATSLAEVGAWSQEIEEFVRVRFPGASQNDINVLQEFITGIHHEGILTGLALSTEEPIESMDAYKFGSAEGYELAIEDIRKLGEQ